jgi:hypothetical protein
LNRLLRESNTPEIHVSTVSHEEPAVDEE